MKEVEIKIRIADVESLIKQLESQGCKLSEALTQEDVVYIPNEIPGVPAPAGTNVLRIRKQGGKTIFTLKQSSAGNHLAKLEHEVEIENGQEMERIIMLLGFKEIARTTKTRRKCKLADYEICVDRVDELGDFLEMEKMTSEDPKKVQDTMLELLYKIGIDVSQRVNVGYDVLYFQKHNS